jgi:RNA polymerase sigma-70 factor (family 1)
MSFQYAELPDHKLLDECAKDNLKAFNELFERYSTKLFNYGLRYVKDESFAEEAMMDVMYWIWEKRHSLNIYGEFQYYIFRAMKNATIKAMRNKAMATVPVETIENHEAFTTAPADHNLKVKEIAVQYNEKLNLLSPQRKLVFRMSREEDLSHAEIADSLNLSINTVKNHISASLSHFRKQLGAYADTATIVTAAFLSFI